MLKTSVFTRPAVTLAALVFGTVAAAAHPHVWIKNRSDVVFNDDGKIVSLIVEWAFDENYSADATEGLDTDGDGSFSSGELEVLTRENLIALKEYDYFVYAKLDGKKVSYGDVTEFGQRFTQGILKMHFTVPLSDPVDPARGKFTYTIYDPSFFIAIDYPDASAVSAIGRKPANCTLEMKAVTGDQETDQTRQMLSEKSPDWQPETEEDFGSLFAQPVNVVCKPKTASQ
ncbi:MAG: DUF1007 family protein [Rhizobiales bacterium]|nr:DUF1007 family protein [Hyphomicrobiales bacterium]